MNDKQEESEKKFQDWLESIVFVDGDGNVLPVTNIDIEKED